MCSCFLDMSKAFERVNHDLLLSKLANKGLPTHFVRIFKSVYAQTTVKVRVNESFSDSWRICRGVTGRNNISLFYYIYIYIYIYIDDILSSISKFNFKVGCFLGFKRVSLSLTVSSFSSLQFLINKMSEMLDKHQLSINVRKTVAMIFNKNL